MTPPDFDVGCPHGKLSRDACLYCKTDSGEREVCEAIYDPMHCIGMRGHLPERDHRWRQGGLVVLRLPLAQRILAALEHEADRVGAGHRDDDFAALASELRAAVERKT